MPSLATRRRRAGVAESACDSMLEGGGNRGSSQIDSQEDTQAKLKAFGQQTNAQNLAKRQAHLVRGKRDKERRFARVVAVADLVLFLSVQISFPLFLFGMLAIFSHSLHLSILSCIIVPIVLGALVFAGVALLENYQGKEAFSHNFEEYGALTENTGCGVL
jgi:hypothetical protein